MINNKLSATRYFSADKPDAESAVKHARRLIGFNKTVLEIGPATGILTRFLTLEQECRVTAIEIDADAAKAAEPFCEAIHVGDIERDDLAALLGSMRYDVVTFGDVLEHLQSPLAALKKVAPYLKPGGYIVVSVPNISHASIAYELAHGRFQYRATGLLDATHIRFFTKDSLVALLDEAGFKVNELCRFSLNPEVTEFQTAAKTRVQQAFLDYLLKNNPESRTYQFVVSATSKISTATGATDSIDSPSLAGSSKESGLLHFRNAQHAPSSPVAKGFFSLLYKTLRERLSDLSIYTRLTS